MRKSVIILVCVVLGIALSAGVAHGTAYETTFDTPDAVDNWTVISGIWTLNDADGTYTINPSGTGGAGTTLSVYTGLLAGGVESQSLTDYTVTAEVVANGDLAGVVARFTNANNYYFFRLQANGNVQLYSYVGGNAINLTPDEAINPAAVPSVYSISLTVQTKQLTAKVLDGTTELFSVAVTDGSHSSGTAGLRDFSLPGSTFGSFRIDITGNASNPSPADETADVPLDVKLSWDTGLNPDDLTQPNPAITKHYVYMATDMNDIIFNWESFLVAEISAGTPPEPTASHSPTGLQTDTTYYWAVDESINNSGMSDPETIIGQIWSFDTFKAAPVIVAGPNDTFVDATGTAEITIDVQSDFLVLYAWYKGEVGDTSTPVGTDSSTLTITNVQPANEGTYWCRVTNNAGSVDSDAAFLGIKRFLAHWTLDQSDYQGGQYLDVEGGHNATVSGTPSFVEGADGEPNGAVEIYAANGWATDGTWDPAAEAGNMTISVWANFHGAISGAHQRLVSKRDVGWDTTAWHLMMGPGSSTVVFESYTSGGAGPTGTLVADGGWQHVCVSYDGSVATLYVNGNEQFDLESVSSATAALTPGMEGSTINLGVGNTAGSLAFNGSMDDVRIYNYPMSLEEVAELWSEVTGRNACLSPPGAADINGDCKVDIDDLILFIEIWLSSLEQQSHN